MLCGHSSSSSYNGCTLSEPIPFERKAFILFDRKAFILSYFIGYLLYDIGGFSQPNLCKHLSSCLGLGTTTICDLESDQ